MITKQQKQRIRRLLEEGESQEKIAKRLNVSRHQVRLVLKESSNQEIQSVANKPTNNLEDFRSDIIQWMEEKDMSSFLIHQRLTSLKLNISLRTVQRYIKTLVRKEVYVPVHVEPGEEGQIDYGYLGEFVREEKRVKVWVFNMVLSYSRYAFYMPVTEQTITSFIHCHQQAFEFFGGSPVSVKIDNLGAGVLEADFYQTNFQQLYLDFLDHYGVTVVNARICRGQDKGKVEAGIKYVKRNFLVISSTSLL